MGRTFKRWILHRDRAIPAGDVAIDPAYFRGEVPKAWRDRVAIVDIGCYELIDGSYERRRFDLWFTGSTMSGEWILEKPGDESWTLTPRS